MLTDVPAMVSQQPQLHLLSLEVLRLKEVQLLGLGDLRVLPWCTAVQTYFEPTVLVPLCDIALPDPVKSERLWIVLCRPKGSRSTGNLSRSG